MMPLKKRWRMDKIWAANWSGTLWKIRNQNALIAVGVSDEGFPLKHFSPGSATVHMSPQILSYVRRPNRGR